MKILTESAFWNTITGKILRWIMFLPVGIMCMFISDYIVEIILTWLSDGKSGLIILFLFGSGLIVGGVMLISGTAFFSVLIAPGRQVGAAALALVYLALKAKVLIQILTIGNPLIPTWLFVMTQIIELIAYGSGLMRALIPE